MKENPTGKTVRSWLSEEVGDLLTKIRKRPGLTGFFLIKSLICAALEGVNALPGMDSIHTSLVKLHSSRIPESFDGMKILFFSDLHSHSFGKHQQRLVDTARALQPDLILVGGDWIKSSYEGTEREIILEAVRGLVTVAPLFTNFGNHEADMDRLKMRQDFGKLGAVALEDETVDLIRTENGREESIKLTGLITRNDYYLGQKPAERRKALRKMMGEFYRGCRRETGGIRLQPDGTLRREMPESTGQADALNDDYTEAFRIVLAHRPNLLRMYARLPADLVLCGHAHGGLMRLGARHRLLAPDQGLFPRYTHGFYRQGRTGMYISEGMGGPRFFIQPEFTLFTLKRDQN